MAWVSRPTKKYIESIKQLANAQEAIIEKYKEAIKTRDEYFEKQTATYERIISIYEQMLENEKARTKLWSERQINTGPFPPLEEKRD